MAWCYSVVRRCSNRRSQPSFPTLLLVQEGPHGSCATYPLRRDFRRTAKYDARSPWRYVRSPTQNMDLLRLGNESCARIVESHPSVNCPDLMHALSLFLLCLTLTGRGSSRLLLHLPWFPAWAGLWRSPIIDQCGSVGLATPCQWRGPVVLCGPSWFPCDRSLWTACSFSRLVGERQGCDMCRHFSWC